MIWLPEFTSSYLVQGCPSHGLCLPGRWTSRPRFPWAVSDPRRDGEL